MKNHIIKFVDNAKKDKTSVSFAERLSDTPIGGDMRAYALSVKQRVAAKEMSEVMERVMQEFERMQMQYLHTLDGLLMKAFRKKFGKHMTTLEAVCCRVDHHQGGPSIYYYYDKPFLKVDKQQVVIEETENSMKATLPLDFEILEDDYVYSR